MRLMSRSANVLNERNSAPGMLRTVKTSDVRTRERGLSPMPEGMGQILSKQDLRNLVEFLSGLK